MFDLILYALLGAAAGVSFVVQQAVNADLRASIGSAAWAGLVSGAKFFGACNSGRLRLTAMGSWAPA